MQGFTPTDSQGRFVFADVREGHWQVAVETPARYVVTTATGTPCSMLVAAGGGSSVTFGLAPAATATPGLHRVRLPVILAGKYE